MFPPKRPEKVRKRRAARTLSNINLEFINKKLMVALKRDSNHLLDESYQGKLKKSSAEDLVRYAKLIKDLRTEEKKEIEGMSMEQLQSLVGTSEKP